MAVPPAASPSPDLSFPPNPTATAIYGNPSAPVGLRIGTGGAGESGLLEALADAFIASQEEHFSVEWYNTHTSDSIDYLRSDLIDVAITYHGVAELVTLRSGIADRVEYAWRDHWMLVGPKSHPTNPPIDGYSTNIYALLALLASVMETAEYTATPVRFLSRYDKSANNIKESNLWSTIGLTPWVEPAAPWYHKYHSSPFQALRKAAELGEYTITDRGTWCAIEPGVREVMKVFVQGSGAENDPLLNPAHLLIGRTAENKDIARAFADWMGKRDGGQGVIETFERHGLVLYEVVPEGVEPLKAAKRLLGR